MADEQNNQQQQQQQQGQQPEKTFSQADVDRIVQDRLNRDRAKFSDYDELRSKVADFEKKQEELNRVDLEKKQEYETLKEGWSKKESEYQDLLNKSRQELVSERITNALNLTVSKMNAYPETAQLIKSQVKYSDDGTMTIQGKDANGMTIDLPLESGVEQFLKDRPYLIKGAGQGGGGSTGGTGQSQSATKDLSKELQDAMAVGDRKRIQEIKTAIRVKHAQAGITRVL